MLLKQDQERRVFGFPELFIAKSKENDQLLKR